MKNKLHLISIIVVLTTFTPCILSAQPGALDGTISEASPGSVDLTSVGTLDWICWARAEGEVDSQKDVDPLITMEAITISNDPDGAPAEVFFYSDPTGNTFLWTDGNPTESVSDVDGGLWIPSAGNGFRITVPAGTNPQTLLLYLGIWQSDCQLVASLSDGSASDFLFTNSIAEEAGDGHVREYRFDFQAGSDQEELIVEWTVTANNDAQFGGWGNVTLRAAALTTGTVDVDENDLGIPEHYQLNQNYPNPFNPNTTISFNLPQNDYIELSIYDLTGRKINTLVNNSLSGGTYTVNWDGRNDQGIIVPSGVYIYRLNTEKFSKTRKMMFLK